MHKVLLVSLTGCLPVFEGDDLSSPWVANLGVPDQQLPLEDFTEEAREVWLAKNPRLVLDAGWGSIAVPFEEDSDPALVRLPGLFETGDEELSLRTDMAGESSGLDHNLWWTVRLAHDELTIGFVLTGDGQAWVDDVTLE